MSPSTSSEEKVRENRLRRMAERQGYDLVKSRRRDPNATDYGRYMVVLGKNHPDGSAGSVVLGSVLFDRAAWSLDDVEHFLTRVAR